MKKKVSPLPKMEAGKKQGKNPKQQPLPMPKRAKKESHKDYAQNSAVKPINNSPTAPKKNTKY